MKRIITIVLYCLSLAGCATPYAEWGLFGGVISAQVSTDTYKVAAGGNKNTSARRVHDFILMKSAELAKASGHTHFRIVSIKDISESYPVQYREKDCIFPDIESTCHEITKTEQVTKPGYDAVIQVFTLRRNKPVPAESYSANDVIREVGARIADPKDR